MKICTFDIETHSLDADSGVLLCASFKPLGGKSYNISTGRRGSNDRELVEQVRNEYEKYDLIVGYYHLGFDVPFLNSRLLYWGLPTLTRKFQIDVYRIARKVFRITRRSLANVTRFLGIEGKTHIDMEIWKKAAFDGDKKCLERIINHCNADVAILERVYERLKDQLLSISRG